VGYKERTVYEQSLLIALVMFGCLLAVVRIAPDWKPPVERRRRRVQRRRLSAGALVRTPTGRPAVVVATDEEQGRAFYVPVNWN
jgi:hypothetical protein